MYSRYNIYLNDIPNRTFTTIYNLFTKKLICVKSSSLEEDKLPVDILDEMMNKGIIIKSESDELKQVEKDFCEFVDQKKELDITLLLTGKCNCKCVYCYESDMNLDFSSFEKSEETIKFIQQMMDRYEYKQLLVSFFGGEPLLKKEQLLFFAKTLNEMYGERFKFGIVTNGTLLCKEEVMEWVKIGLYGMKITIDGNRESHNKRRTLKDGTDAYTKIMKNLKEIAVIKNLELTIAIVVDEEIYGIEEMIKELVMNGVHAKFCFSIREPDHYDYKKKADIIVRCASILKKCGVFQYSSIATNHGEICCGKQKSMFAIDGLGNVYGCTGNFTKPIGTISNQAIGKEYTLPKDCITCMYRTICQGECLYNRKCQKMYFKEVVPRLLKLFIEKIA